jgi:hypothetical protein
LPDRGAAPRSNCGKNAPFSACFCTVISAVEWLLIAASIKFAIFNSHEFAGEMLQLK